MFCPKGTSLPSKGSNSSSYLLLHIPIGQNVSYFQYNPNYFAKVTSLDSAENEKILLLNCALSVLNFLHEKTVIPQLYKLRPII